MMKEQLRQFAMLTLVAVLSLFPLSSRAQVVIGNFTYTFSGNEATITATSIQNGGNIVFPEKVIYSGRTYDVTAIVYTNDFIRWGQPTSLTGNSIKSITGSTNQALYTGGSRIGNCEQIETVSFPKLEVLKNCTFLRNANKLQTLNLPALKLIDGARVLNGSTSVTSVSCPLLDSIYGGSCFSSLSALTSLELPKLRALVGSAHLSELTSLETLSLPSLQMTGSYGGLRNMPKLRSLNVPELTTVSGRFTFGGLTSLVVGNFPKLISIEDSNVFGNCRMRVLNLAPGCKIGWESYSLNTFMGSTFDSLTVTGVTHINDSRFLRYCTSLKYVSFPDLVHLKGWIGRQSLAIRTFEAPNLTTLEDISFFKDEQERGEHNDSLTTVYVPKLTTLKNAQLFSNAPIQFLTLSGVLQADADSRINLDTYPAVVTVVDADVVNDIPATLFSNVKGGRFIVPKGKAGLFATKWNLPLDKAMVYSPVTVNKSTGSSLYASGSILPGERSFTYGGTTYSNQYDFTYAMTGTECLNPEVLGVNDVGFTPNLSTLSVQNYTNPLSSFKAYYAGGYTDAITTTGREGELTLSPLATTTGTIQGFSSSSIDAHEGIGASTKGFLFNGNTDILTELYLPYAATATTPTTNYFEVGTGTAQTSREGGNYKFYWYPGDATYPAGFYECRNTVIPEGRAYLSIPASMLSSAKSFKLVFEDGLTTNIASTTIALEEKSVNDGWYTLQGVRLPNKPTQAGVYLHNGQKIAIR